MRVIKPALLIGLTICTFVIVLFACSKSGGGYGGSNNGGSNNGGGNSNGNSVAIQGFAFSESSLSVKSGTTVTWTNNDQTSHTVTADDASFDSGNIAPGGKYTHTFNAAGTIAYHCSIHPTMKAKVVVGN